MEIGLIIIIVILASVLIFQSFRISKIVASKNEDQSVKLLKMDVIELNKSLNRMRENIDANLTNFNEKVSEKLEILSKFLKTFYRRMLLKFNINLKMAKLSMQLFFLIKIRFCQ